jgi:hypothetical protein
VACVLLALGMTLPLGTSGIGVNGWTLIVVALPIGHACLAAQTFTVARRPQTDEESRRYRGIVFGRKLLNGLPAVPIVALAWLSLTRQPHLVRVYAAGGLVIYFVLLAAFWAWYALQRRELLQRLTSAPRAA